MPSQIRTTHAGSLPRPEDLVELNHRRVDGELDDEAAYQDALGAAVADVVARQCDAGIDIVNDGEYGHSMGSRYDFGSWFSYVFQRLGGLELKPDFVAPAEMHFRRDFARFGEAYADPESGAMVVSPTIMAGVPVVTGPITYTGQKAVAADIAHFKAALAKAGLETGYLSAIAPGSCARFGNLHYEDEEEYLFAAADAMRKEYKAIVDAGLMLQLDDPAIAETWDSFDPEPSTEDYRRWVQLRVEAINHAIRDLPADRIRFHLCWGSWHGPHSTDLPLEHLVDLMLKINAGAYSFEAANARHEHEWKVWREVELPEDKVILPGIVGHSTNVLEHPELVADRIANFVSCVGPERVIASTDCGLGGRVHPQIAWAKLEALAEGAALASGRLG